MLFSTSFFSTVALAAAMANAYVLPRHDIAAGEYTLVFTNQTGAVQGTDFLTFGLFATTTECTTFCDSVPTCGFANSYHDNNGKGGSPLLTCSLYLGCHDEADLTNTGGQPQPDGTVNFITDSDGWCKAAGEPDPTTTTAPADPTTTPADPTTTTAPADPTTTPADPTTTTAPADPTTTPADTTTEPADPTPTVTSEPTEPTNPPPEA